MYLCEILILVGYAVDFDPLLLEIVLNTNFICLN
jgi:hypothetical protein